MVRLVVVLTALLAAVSGCGGSNPTESPSNRPTTPTAPSPSATHDPWSLPALFEQKVQDSAVTWTGFLGDSGPYVTHTVTYKSGDLTVSGLLSVPKGNGPFPAVVLNHGHIARPIYRTGMGMHRERDYLARQGFVVLHTDYRGHAQSSPTTELDHELRLGYARDAIAAVKALKHHPKVDAERVAMAGRSMGGGVTFGALVIEPGLVDAAVVWASVSTDYVDNYRRWTVRQRPGNASQVVQRFGSYRDNQKAWRELSPRYYLDRVDASVMMHHGTADESCPYEWATDTEAALRNAEVDVTLHTYRGEHHTFYPKWELSMQRTVAFLRKNA